MKYTPRPFDNSDEAIEALKQEHKEAQEFVHGRLKHVGLEGCGSGLDFDDIFHLMSEYKRKLQEQLKPVGVLAKVCTSCNNSTDELMNFGLGKDICQDCFNEFEAWRKAKGRK